MFVSQESILARVIFARPSKWKVLAKLLQDGRLNRDLARSDKMNFFAKSSRNNWQDLARVAQDLDLS